jgi:hypothetical protein
MIMAMIASERDPQALAALARGRMKARHGDLAGALDGMSGNHHGELAQMLPGQIAFLDDRISALSARTGQAVTAVSAAWGADADGATGPEAGTGPGRGGRRSPASARTSASLRPETDFRYSARSLPAGKYPRRSGRRVVSARAKLACARRILRCEIVPSERACLGRCGCGDRGDGGRDRADSVQ